MKNLDLLLTANYNHNITNNVDTASRAYNWRGDFYEKGSRGEQSYQNSESKNKNWNGTLKMNYHIGQAHTFTFSHVISDFERTSRSTIGASSKFTDFSIPKITRKNVSGLSLPSDAVGQMECVSICQILSAIQQGTGIAEYGWNRQLYQSVPIRQALLDMERQVPILYGKIFRSNFRTKRLSACRPRTNSLEMKTLKLAK